MKIGKEYINSRYVTYVGPLVESAYGDEDTPLKFTANCTDGKKYHFWFANKEYGNHVRNKLIEEVENV